jgi:hypothetical protein
MTRRLQGTSLAPQGVSDCCLIYPFGRKPIPQESDSFGFRPLVVNPVVDLQCHSYVRLTTMSDAFTQPEPFVDATRAAEFLSIRPRQLLELARANILPGHPIGRGNRRAWRFRLSELAASVTRGVDSGAAVPDGQKARRKR